MSLGLAAIVLGVVLILGALTFLASQPDRPEEPLQW